MSLYAPGDAVQAEFTTQDPTTSNAADLDLTPVGIVNRNGVDDVAVVVTVTNLDTGRYVASFTIPIGYAVGDNINLTVSGTVSGKTGKACEWRAKLTDAQDRLNRIGTADIITTSPVSQGGDVELFIGDDYLAADGRSLIWTGATTNVWPNLTGATITFYVGDGMLTVTGSVVTPTGTQQVKASPTAAQTATCTTGDFDYAVRAVLANGHKVTLVRGVCTTVDSEDA